MNFFDFKQNFQKIEPEQYPTEVSTNPLVSICVQTFQHEQYISECLDSLLAQETNFDYEILLGEDNSTDSTRKICIEYAQQHPDKIRLFLHHNENKIKVDGITTGNFNALYNFYQAGGKYIAFCEGDDYWNDPLKLQRQVEFLEHHSGYVLAYHSYNHIDADGKSLNQNEFPIQPRKDITSEELKKNQAHPLLQTICFRNSFKKLPLEAVGVVNLDTFLLSILGLTGDGKYLSDIGPSKYRIQNQGLWSKKEKKEKLKTKLVTFQNLIEYYRRIRNEDLVNHYSQILKNHHKMLITNHLKEGEFISGVQELLKYLGLKS